jgi:hypothetical protein
MKYVVALKKKDNEFGAQAGALYFKILKMTIPKSF